MADDHLNTECTLLIQFPNRIMNSCLVGKGAENNGNYVRIITLKTLIVNGCVDLCS